MKWKHIAEIASTVFIQAPLLFSLHRFASTRMRNGGGDPPTKELDLFLSRGFALNRHTLMI